jgi:hypothetical protein
MINLLFYLISNFGWYETALRVKMRGIVMCTLSLLGETSINTDYCIDANKIGNK